MINKKMYKKYKESLYLENVIINYIEFLDQQIEQVFKSPANEYSFDYLQQLLNSKEYFEISLFGKSKKRKNDDMEKDKKSI